MTYKAFAGPFTVDVAEGQGSFICSFLASTVPDLVNGL